MQKYIEMNQDRNHAVTEKGVTNKNWILDYKINREHHYVEITQWNGREKKIYFHRGQDKVMQETLDKMQKDQFDKMVEAMEKDLKVSITNDAFLNLACLGLGVAAASVSLLAGGFFASFTLLSLPSLEKLKLKRDLHLIGWIIDNKKDVDRVIHHDVDSKRKVDLSQLTPFIDYSVYPNNVPYSEEMYNNGINLNNISELSNRELQKLKRKTMSFQEKKRNK